MPVDTTQRLTEEQVADAFHSYLKSSLSQAKAERLLDLELLSSAEADLMITGPALCLYFGALRSTTSPPSVPLPRSSKSGEQLDLSQDNCPAVFIPFLQIWSRNVSPIQELAPEYQHDLARIICSLEPIAQPLNPSLNRIAAELRALAIEISQRRTFQDRYAADLQAAIDAGEGPDRSASNASADQGVVDEASGGRTGRRRRVMASFVPPPMYEPSPSPSPNPSPSSVTVSLPTTEPLSPRRQTHLQPPPTPTSPRTSSPYSSSRSRTPSPSSTASSSRSSPSFAVDAPSIQLIRETLYASLGDILATHPYLRRLLVRDPPRAYFASVALAILDVSLTRTSIDPIEPTSPSSAIGSTYGRHSRTTSTSSAYSTETTEEPSVMGILGAKLTLHQTPRELWPFMRELCEIGRVAREMEEEDSLNAVEVLQSGGSELPEPSIDRVRRMLERGIDAEHRRRRSSRDDEDDEDDTAPLTSVESHRRSIEGRAILLTNRVNGLSLSMTKLRAFRERQSDVFKVLASVRV